MFFLQQEIELEILRPGQTNLIPGAVARRRSQYLKTSGNGPKKFHELFGETLI